MGVGFLVCFTGFCYALLDWEQDLHAGVYQRDHFEAFYETAALILYIILSLRFLGRSLKNF
ncbi:hypothetical protein GCM10028773_50770 [Spirosoma koreense]